VSRLREEPMRAILAAAILLLCVAPAAAEPEYPSSPGSSDLDGGRSLSSLVEVESARIRGELEQAAAAEVGDLRERSAASPAPAAPAANPNAPAAALPNRSEAETAPSVPLDQLCDALVTSAQDNDLPVAFFANLIWQESRLRDNAVSPKGALGIAQFMPKVAVEAGLLNPFDPLQALPASARLLRDLRSQFGNLGFVAAAYNAGARRVSAWLERGHTLPRETRGYVMSVTGHSVEQWQKAPLADDDLRFARQLPCRDLPTFAELEQAQEQQAKLDPEPQTQTQAQSQASQPAQEVKTAMNPRPAKHPKRERTAEAKRDRGRSRREPLRTAQRERDHARHEAKEHMRGVAHGRHMRA
jgi:hypothetical protein